MKKIYINEKKINLIAENSISPDSFEYNGENFSCYDYDAIPFIYDNIKNIFYYCEYNGTHWDLKRDITAKKLGYSDYADFCNNIDKIKYKTIDDIKEEFYHTVKEISSELKDSTEGRFWLKSKFIAFWGSYVPIETINVIIKNIEKHFNVDYSNPLIVIGNNIIPYNEYNKNININIDNDKKLKAIHLMNQKEKKDNLTDFRKLRGELDDKKLGNMTMAQYHNLIYQESKLSENYELEIKPSEINVNSFKIKNHLNKHIWNGDVLNSRVRLKLLDISDDFIDYMNIKWIKPIDIILTGSICNYNWSKFSDIDVHIVIDFSQVNEKIDLVREYFNLKKNQWNNEHINLTIFNHNVEIYVEDIHDQTVSNGIYSLTQNKWIHKPLKFKDNALTNNIMHKVKLYSANIITKIDNLETITNSVSDKKILGDIGNVIDFLLLLIKHFRQKSLKLEGELGVGNLVYKVLRRLGYLDKIWDLKTNIYDKINSIE